MHVLVYRAHTRTVHARLRTVVQLLHTHTPFVTGYSRSGSAGCAVYRCPVGSLTTYVIRGLFRLRTRITRLPLRLFYTVTRLRFIRTVTRTTTTRLRLRGCRLIHLPRVAQRCTVGLYITHALPHAHVRGYRCTAHLCRFIHTHRWDNALRFTTCLPRGLLVAGLTLPPRLRTHCGSTRVRLRTRLPRYAPLPYGYIPCLVLRWFWLHLRFIHAFRFLPFRFCSPQHATHWLPLRLRTPQHRYGCTVAPRCDCTRTHRLLFTLYRTLPFPHYAHTHTAHVHPFTGLPSCHGLPARLHHVARLVTTGSLLCLTHGLHCTYYVCGYRALLYCATGSVRVAVGYYTAAAHTPGSVLTWFRAFGSGYGSGCVWFRLHWVYPHVRVRTVTCVIRYIFAGYTHVYRYRLHFTFAVLTRLPFTTFMPFCWLPPPPAVPRWVVRLVTTTHYALRSIQRTHGALRTRGCTAHAPHTHY